MANITQKDKEYFLSLKPEDITFDFLISSFADSVTKVNGKVVHKPSKYKTSDVMTLKAGEFINKTAISKTNVGLFIFNKFIFEGKLAKVIPYHNIPLNDKVVGDIEKELSKALMMDVITVSDMVTYLDKMQWLSKQFHSAISGSFTMNTLKPHKQVVAKREKFIKEHEEEIKNGDTTVAIRLEKELLAEAEELFKDDPGMDLYKSGARGSFGNNFKNISVMRGSVYNPTTGKFDIITSNFMEGIKKKDIPTYGNTVIEGAYPKAVGTQVSGYLAKQLTAAMQAVQLDKKGSDCGSKATIDILITPKNKQLLNFRYIVEGSKLILLDDSNMSRYIGRKVKMRTPLYCTSPKICRVCAGTILERLGIENIGLASTRVASTLLNASMKKFHDSSMKLNDLSIDDILI